MSRCLRRLIVRSNIANTALSDARSQLVLCGNFVVSLFLMAPTPDQVQATFRLLESTQSALKIWRELADNEDAISLLRPTLLRIDTLFTQAARMMDTGNI